MFADDAALKPANPSASDFSIDLSSPKYARRASSFESMSSSSEQAVAPSSAISERLRIFVGPPSL